MTGPAVEARSVTFRYPGPRALPPILEDVSLEVEPLDFLGLIGPNGGGKTTLLKILLGILEPQAGEVRVLGRRPPEVSRRIGYVPQHAQIDVHFPASVLDVVLTGRLGRAPWGFSYARGDLDAASEAMARVGITELGRRGIGELSGGQRQRVLIARALAAEAEILLLDEPMAGVDLHMEQDILETLHLLNEHLPIVLVSHDLGFISAHVKRVACLNRTLVVHRAGEITGEAIAATYRAAAPVHQIRHRDDCPTARPPEEAG